MTIATSGHPASELTSERPTKRARFAPDVLESAERQVPKQRSPPPPSSLHRSHPLQIKPSGNALFNPVRAARVRAGGLGAFSVLPDELILEILTHLPPHTLFRLQAVSRVFFIFSRHQSLWKVHYISAAETRMERWEGDWRRTYWAAFCAPENVVHALREDEDDLAENHDLVLPADGIGAPEFCSDVLYQPHLCAAPLHHYFITPNALASLKRENGSKLDASSFAQLYAETSIPVVLSDLMVGWPCFMDPSHSWALQSLVARFGDTPFRAEAVTIPVSIYGRYCKSVERGEGAIDESPVYLFDSEFVRRSNGEMGEEFTVPALFGEDLFRVMGSERPDYRWLIAGPARSGSTWHKDPNATSAWNAVVTGSKGWILFPPYLPPPGVFVTEDESEVTAPLSLAEWFSSYYAHALETYGPNARDPQKRGKMVQGVCRAGEIMYIPAGWWHLVVNLESSVAVTQNFVSEVELPTVLRFLERRPEQVSGFKLRAMSTCSANEADEEQINGGVFSRFCEALEREVPEVLKRARAKLAKTECEVEHREERTSWWDTLKSQGEGDSSFSLGLEIDDELGDAPW